MTYRKRTLSRRYGKVASSSSSHSRKYFHTTLMSIIQIASYSTARRRRLLLYTLHISICSTLSFSQIKNIEWTYKKKKQRQKNIFLHHDFYFVCVWVIYWYEERKRWDIFFCSVYMHHINHSAVGRKWKVKRWTSEFVWRFFLVFLLQDFLTRNEKKNKQCRYKYHFKWLHI